MTIEVLKKNTSPYDASDEIQDLYFFFAMRSDLIIAHPNN